MHASARQILALMYAYVECIQVLGGAGFLGLFPIRCILTLTIIWLMLIMTFLLSVLIIVPYAVPLLSSLLLALGVSSEIFASDRCRQRDEQYSELCRLSRQFTTLSFIASSPMYDK